MSVENHITEFCVVTVKSNRGQIITRVISMEWELSFHSRVIMGKQFLWKLTTGIDRYARNFDNTKIYMFLVVIKTEKNDFCISY